MTDMRLVEQIMKVATGSNGENYDPDMEKAKERISAAITEWSRAAEADGEVEHDLPSLEDIHEAYADFDADKLHDQAVKVRLALHELESSILSHIRNLMSLTQSVIPLLDEAEAEEELSEENIPDFLKGLPTELIVGTIQEMILTEAAGIIVRLVQFDAEHAPDGGEA